MHDLVAFEREISIFSFNSPLFSNFIPSLLFFTIPAAFNSTSVIGLDLSIMPFVIAF